MNRISKQADNRPKVSIVTPCRGTIISEGIEMAVNKGLLAGSTPLLLLSLLEEQDRYGYEMIRTLEDRSDRTFSFKEGTLYPVLHKLENDGHVRSYYKEKDGRQRRYYAITERGIRQLAEEKVQWDNFSFAVKKVIGGEANAFA